MSDIFTLPSSTPTELPHGWRSVRFNEMAQSISDRVDNPAEAGVEYYVGLEHLDPDSLKIRRWGKPDDVEATKLRFQPGDIIFARRRAYQRKLGVAEFEGICSAHALVLRAKEDTVLREFLPFFMQSDVFFERALRISVGSLSPTINWKTLAQQQFVIPPLDEQYRIAEILWAADEAIEKNKTLLVEAKKHRHWLMQTIFEPTGTAIEGDTSRLFPLGQMLIYASDGPFGSKLKTEHYVGSGARVIRLQNIEDDHFNGDDAAYISLSYYKELPKYALKTGDILVAGLGDDRHPVGRACQIPSSILPAINKADCFCLRADLRVLDQGYLAKFLNSSYAQRQIQGVQQGTTRDRVNVTNLKTINIPVPSLQDQLNIYNLLEQVKVTHNQIKTDIKTKIDLFNQLREYFLSPRG